MGKDVTIIEGQPRRRGRYSRAAAAEADENERVSQKKKGEQSEDRKTPHIDIQGSDVGRKRVGRALPPPNSPPPPHVHQRRSAGVSPRLRAVFVFVSEHLCVCVCVCVRIP